MNWTQCKTLYDAWGGFEQQLHRRADAHALAAWQSLSISAPSEECLQSLTRFCNKHVTEEVLYEFISHSWQTLGQVLCSEQRDWLLDGKSVDPQNQQAGEALWAVLAQSARAKLGLVSDEELGKMICPGATAEQLLEMILPPTFFGDFAETLRTLRIEPLHQLPSTVYHPTDFPWEQIQQISDQMIEITGVGVGIAPQLLGKTLTDITQIVGGIQSSLAGTELSQMTWSTLNLLKPPLHPTAAGMHTGITQNIDIYVSEDFNVSAIDVFAHEWGHYMEYQVGHSACDHFSDSRLKNLQEPLEQLVNAVLNTPQCPVAAHAVRQSFNDEMAHNLATYLNRSSSAPSDQNLWERLSSGQDVHSVLLAGVENADVVENHVRNLVAIFSDFNQQLMDGKSAWISYSIASDRLAQLNGQIPREPGYLSDPREIFARAIEVSMPSILGISPKTARYEMYPHDGEYMYVCEQVKEFLVSLAPAPTLSEKINKKRGAGMVTVKLGAKH